MNEQWNNALDQVKDEFLLEAVRYRKKRYWPGAAAAAAAALVLAAGWFLFRPQMPPDAIWEGSTVGTPSTQPPNMPPPGNTASDSPTGTLRGDGSPDDVTCGVEEETPVIKTLHYSSCEELQTACMQQQEWFLHRDVMVPQSNGDTLTIKDITVFETEMYNKPWVWYFISHIPHMTVRIPTMPSLTANMDPDTSGSEALRQIWPEAPNLHNREEFTDNYTEIREVKITTSEGEKTALFRKEADRDRVYLTFLQNGTLVTIAGPEKELAGNWLETFSLMPINSLEERSCL